MNLTADFDLDAGTRSGSQRAITCITTGIGGATHLFRVAPEDGAVEQITTGLRRIRGLSIDMDPEQ